MGILDAILQTRIAQYSLLLLLIILIALSVWLKIANLGLSTRLDVANKTIKGYELATALQNEGIRQMQVAGEEAKKKAERATADALEARKASKGRVTTIMTSNAPTACEEARQYALGLAKQLLEQKP
jgi:hypothetical protein